MLILRPGHKWKKSGEVFEDCKLVRDGQVLRLGTSLLLRTVNASDFLVVVTRGSDFAFSLDKAHRSTKTDWRGAVSEKEEEKQRKNDRGAKEW